MAHLLLRRPLLSSLPARTLSLPLRPFTSTSTSRVAKMTIIGRLAAEPELTATSTGQEIVKYAVGTSYGPRDNRQTSWFRVASFVEAGPRRDHLLGLGKGTLVYVEGDAQMRQYEDGEGKRLSALSVVQRNIEVLKRPDPNPKSDGFPEL